MQGLSVLQDIESRTARLSLQFCSRLHDSTGMWRVSQLAIHSWISKPIITTSQRHSCLYVRLGRVNLSEISLRLVELSSMSSMSSISTDEFHFTTRDLLFLQLIWIFQLSRDVKAFPTCVCVFTYKKHHVFFIRKHIRIYVLRFSSVISLFCLNSLRIHHPNLESH
ncbi:hypothetical protein BR93DRAFT_296731 [Coniochaeta sp. PMI_546]|nr:hypothetical protein BR93DRAFT_296731 [Coniochaeta sp. PMI_546]